MRIEKREELRKIVADLYVELGSGDAVIKRLGMARTTVYRLLKEAGVALPDRNAPELYQRRKGLQGDQAEAAVQDYVNGIPLEEIAEKYGVGQYSLRTAIKSAGVERRPHGGQSRKIKDAQEEEIVRLYCDSGISQAHIAAKFKISQSVISRVLRQRGIYGKRASGSSHGNWSGGRIRTGSGYFQVLVSQDDPMAAMRSRSGYVMEHRLVMARYLGRPLTENETVHHIDGNRENNNISNLQLRISNHGKGSSYCCADCGSRNIVTVELREESVEYES